MAELEFVLVDEDNFADIPAPAQVGARCQTCDYWERLDGGREAPPDDAPDRDARERLKRERLLSGRRLAGSYGILAIGTDTVERTTVAYAQFGPISQYPRAQTIRERYADLPESPAPWVVTCLQVAGSLHEGPEREAIASSLLEAVCAEMDRRGVGAVEAYPEGTPDAWLPSPGPAAVYAASGFEHVAGDERYPVYRRELTGEADEATWGDLLRRGTPSDEDEGWPLPLPSQPDEDDFFRLPPDKPNRPNPFGDD